MKPIRIIIATLIILLACDWLHATTGIDFTLIMIVGTSLWIATDSKKIEIKKYKSGISYGPVVLFIATLLLWIVAFPWYLIVREKIKSGKAHLKEVNIEYKNSVTPKG